MQISNAIDKDKLWERETRLYFEEWPINSSHYSRHFLNLQFHIVELIFNDLPLLTTPLHNKASD